MAQVEFIIKKMAWELKKDLTFENSKRLHFQNEQVFSLHRPSHPRIFALLDFHSVDILLPVVHMIRQNLDFIVGNVKVFFGFFRSIFRSTKNPSVLPYLLHPNYFLVIWIKSSSLWFYQILSNPGIHGFAYYYNLWCSPLSPRLN